LAGFVKKISDSSYLVKLMILAEGTIIGSQWKIGKLVGEGACGRVYAITCTNPANACSFPLVAKVIPTPVGTGKAANAAKLICDTLYYEYTLFHGQLCNFSYRPNIPDVRCCHGVDKVHNVRYMIMERFERDLVGYAKAAKPDNRAVANIGLQILEGLEWMHNKGMLFIDVKPDNFMLTGDKIKFVDYGLVERWRSDTGKRI
jgi:serine/threonine protein kinase